jgi:hypothetical protein
MINVKLVYIILLLLGFSLAACRSAPAYTIEEEKMVAIMVDMIFAEQVIRRYPFAVRDSVQDQLMQSLLKIHKVSKEQVDSNLYLYQHDLILYTNMVDRMKSEIDRISEESQ